jgi:hypothetical protein
MTIAQDAASVTNMADVLLGLGLPGVVILALGYVARVLYTRAAEDAAYHRTRADRLDEELRALNATVRTEYITTISKATEAISDALGAVDTSRRG